MTIGNQAQGYTRPGPLKIPASCHYESGENAHTSGPSGGASQAEFFVGVIP